jgi:hypothetical protein
VIAIIRKTLSSCHFRDNQVILTREESKRNRRPIKLGQKRLKIITFRDSKSGIRCIGLRSKHPHLVNKQLRCSLCQSDDTHTHTADA